MYNKNKKINMFTVEEIEKELQKIYLIKNSKDYIFENIIPNLLHIMQWSLNEINALKNRVNQ